MINNYSLYLVVQSDACKHQDLRHVVSGALAGGVTTIQLREKGLSDRAYFELARDLAALLKNTNIPLLLNDRVDIALALDVAGVHIGQSDLPIAEVRRLLGPHKIIGLSVENEGQLTEAISRKPDYIALSPLFSTPTKTDLGIPWEIEGLKRARRKTNLPIIGIGGINADNITEVKAAGADGVAVVSAICGAEDPRQATVTLLKAWGEISVLRSTTHQRKYTRALTIAGSDSGGGAGIQADLKTFSALGVYGMSVITALTAQNTRSVMGITDCPADIVEKQIDAVLSDIGTDAVKIGMLFNAAIIQAVARSLKKYEVKKVVLDPVMVAKSGDSLLQEAARKDLVEFLFPMTQILTPNILEAQALLDRRITNREGMEGAARELSAWGPRGVLLKGGHLGERGYCADCYFDGESRSLYWFEGERVETGNTHGTGCTLSSAIAAYLAKGLSPVEAIQQAKNYLQKAIQSGSAYRLGEGHGPVHHFWNHW